MTNPMVNYSEITMTPDVRVTERVEWRNVYTANRYTKDKRWSTREMADEFASIDRIAVERITITERVERFPVPEEGGR